MQKLSCDYCDADLAPNTTATTEGEVAPLRMKQRVVLKGKAIAVDMKMEFTVKNEYGNVPQYVCKSCHATLTKALVEEVLAKL
jgi:hypothetical protein